MMESILGYTFSILCIVVHIAVVVWLLVKVFRFWRKNGTASVLIVAALIAGAGWAVWYWWEAIETYAPYVIGGIVAVWFVTSGALGRALGAALTSRDNSEEQQRQEEMEWWIAEDNKRFWKEISGNKY